MTQRWVEWAGTRAGGMRIPKWSTPLLQRCLLARSPMQMQKASNWLEFNGIWKGTYPQIVNFYFFVIKKAEEGFRRLLTPLQPLLLTNLSTKIFDFQAVFNGFSFWFFNDLKIWNEINDKNLWKNVYSLLLESCLWLVRICMFQKFLCCMARLVMG